MPCRNLGSHVAFTSILHSHTPLVPRTQCEAKLDWLPLFHQWKCLKCNGHGLLVSCVKWPLANLWWNAWKPDWKTNFPWFRYGYRKSMRHWYLNCIQRFSQLCFTIECKKIIDIYRRSSISFNTCIFCDVCSLIFTEPHTNQILGFNQENQPLKTHLPWVGMGCCLPFDRWTHIGWLKVWMSNVRESIFGVSQACIWYGWCEWGIWWHMQIYFPWGFSFVFLLPCLGDVEVWEGVHKGFVDCVAYTNGGNYGRLGLPTKVLETWDECIIFGTVAMEFLICLFLSHRMWQLHVWFFVISFILVKNDGYMCWNFTSLGNSMY